MTSHCATPATILARLVARLRCMVSAGPGFASTCHQPNKADDGHAMITALTQSNDGLPPQALSVQAAIHRRAMRTRNRNPKAVAIYVERNMILSRER